MLFKKISPFIATIVLLLTACGGGSVNNGTQTNTTTEAAGDRFALIFTIDGLGSVTLAPTGDDCGTHCYMYNLDTEVKMTAVPNDGFVFTGWEGACAAAENPCTVTMTKDTPVTVTFDTAPAKRAKASGSWDGMVWQ